MRLQNHGAPMHGLEAFMAEGGFGSADFLHGEAARGGPWLPAMQPIEGKAGGEHHNDSERNEGLVHAWTTPCQRLTATSCGANREWDRRR
jgi:hypothetical protein